MTTRIADASNFLDVNGLNNIRLQSKSDNKEDKAQALEKVAKQFESLFMQMLLKSMRKAQDVLESDSPFNSQSVKFYRDMHDQQLAVELSANGSLGLAPLIVRQLGGDSENFTPHSVLRLDGGFDTQQLSRQLEPRQPDHSKADGIVIKNVTNRASGNGLNDNQLEIPFVAPKVNTISAPIFVEPKDFVTAISAPAKRAQQQLGVPFEVIIAQAALETGWGQKIIKTEQGKSSNNLFNIKADERWQGDKTQKETLEYQQGAMVKTRSPFRVYQSINESVNDFVNFLSTSERYQDALNKTSDVEQFLHGLQKAGYATDPNYANKILATLGKVTDLLKN